MSGNFLVRRVIMVAVLLLLPLQGLAGAEQSARAVSPEGQDDDAHNNDDFFSADVVASDTFLEGSTNISDQHRIDTFVLTDVPAGKIINVSVQIVNWSNQALMLTAWNRYTQKTQATSNHEDAPTKRPWEAVSLLCVITGDYYLQLKPIAGSGRVDYVLHARVYDAEDITSKLGTGGGFGAIITGSVSSEKWNPCEWYRFRMSGEENGLNEYACINLTLPGAPDKRLMADLYLRSLEPESWSYWLNQSWWLDDVIQYQEVRAAACHPGERWYYLTVQATDSTGPRSDYFELRAAKLRIESDGDNHPLSATPVRFAAGNFTARCYGEVRRGPDMFDWYKVYLSRGEGVSVNFTALEKSVAVFRASIYRDNLTATTPEKGYDLQATATNKPGDTYPLKNFRVSTNEVDQEGWYYIGIIANIGLVPYNISREADWTVQTAWAKYAIDVTVPHATSPPVVVNSSATVVVPEDGESSALKLSGPNGIFTDPDLSKSWGDALTFSTSGNSNLWTMIANTSIDPEASVTFRPIPNWNGEAKVMFTATDLYGNANSTSVAVRVTPESDPPEVIGEIPDFSVSEGCLNETMLSIDLTKVFSDPDLPPFGNDRLTYTLDCTVFQASIMGSILVFGQAPFFAGQDDHIVPISVTAVDSTGLTCTQSVNITVLTRNRPPVPSNCTVTMLEDQIITVDLNRYVDDPDGDKLRFAYLGGASPNLTVILFPNGGVTLKPAPDYFAALEKLNFKMDDGSGTEVRLELHLSIQNVNDPPCIMSTLPDPMDKLIIKEGEYITFDARVTDIDTKATELVFEWYVDEMLSSRTGPHSFTWNTGYNDSGAHTIALWVSDGEYCVDTEWEVTVRDVNRPPLIRMVTPRNGAVFPWNEKINFFAVAEDPDGDNITFLWTLENGTQLAWHTGRPNSSFSRSFTPGKTYSVILQVSDEKGATAIQPIEVRVEEKPDPSAVSRVFTTLGIILTVASALVVLILLLKRANMKTAAEEKNVPPAGPVKEPKRPPDIPRIKNPRSQTTGRIELEVGSTLRGDERKWP